MEKRRELTEEELQVAAALKQIWDVKKKELKLSQERAANEMEFSSQSSVSQYLRGNIPLNTDAKLKFAKLLGVAVTEFDPSFAENESLVTAHKKMDSDIDVALSGLDASDIARVKDFIAGLKSAKRS